METTFTVKEIHDSFYTAGEAAVMEAKRIIETNEESLSNEANRFIKIGFSSAKAVKIYEEFKAKKQVANQTIEAVQYFAIHYPKYKFITNEDVKKLCEKYGLMEGGCEQYLGEIPEKNLRDIEAFKLRKEDWVEKSAFDDRIFRWFQPLPSDYIGGIDPTRTEETATGLMGIIQSKPRQAGRQYADRLMAEYFAFPQIYADAKKIEDKKKETEQPKFRICAPKSDFNTLGYEVREGYKLVYDPIVLQPVQYNGIKGNLIITAWGDEASDLIVVNEKMN